MPEIDIPLFSGVYKNIDETVSNDESFKLIDGILEKGSGSPSIFSRPGITLTIRLGATGDYAAVDGVYWWEARRQLIALTNGYLAVSSDLINFTLLAGDRLLVGARPTFASDGTHLYIANGTRIAKYDVDGVGYPVFLADAQAPTAVTHIAILDTYLLANSVGSETWYFSEVGDPASWAALDFASAESEPDDVNSLIKFRGEVYLHGRETFEVWEDDGQTPFAPIAGGSFDTGCIAPYSILQMDNELIWLSNRRQFVSFGGGNIERLSTQFDKDISAMSVVSDCTADRYDILGKSIVVFQFPSEQRTLYYNATDKNWGEFGYWNSAGGYHEAFIGACHVMIPDSGRHFIGSRKADGYIYEMDESYPTDNGTQIKMLSRSGHMNYGTNKRKRNENMSIRVKRGYVTDTSTPVATLRFRDDNGEWSQEIQFSLGAMGDYFNTTRLQRLGMYGTRQLEFACSDPVGFVFSEAKEEVTVMNR